jgi:hypothetical protein
LSAAAPEAFLLAPAPPDDAPFLAPGTDGRAIFFLASTVEEGLVLDAGLGAVSAGAAAAGASTAGVASSDDMDVPGGSQEVISGRVVRELTRREGKTDSRLLMGR